MTETGCQTIVIGAGITGLAIARELLARGAQDILVLEKEEAVGLHASGRNSGVLHAGIYYTPDSLKARFCVDGNRLMKQFCRDKALTLQELGKVVVARNPSEIDSLRELKRRADACGARAALVDEKELADIEPHARTCGQALYSPGTAVMNPTEVLTCLEKELLDSGRVRIMYGTPFQDISRHGTVLTPKGTIRYEKLINAAGAYGDRVAQRFGLAREYRTLPFKGTYRKLAGERRFLVRGNIYPVPDLRNPFLGVHLTMWADGEVYVGPTAIPAFGRENYGLFGGISREAIPIVMRDVVLFTRNAAFRQVALTEPKKYARRFMYSEASALVPYLKPRDLVYTNKTGIRPQLVHWPSGKLVMDFVVLKDGETLHILNPISPAFTSSMAFAQYAVDMLLAK